MSRPRAATFVATSTFVRSPRKASIVRSRTFWERLPCRSALSSPRLRRSRLNLRTPYLVRPKTMAEPRWLRSSRLSVRSFPDRVIEVSLDHAGDPVGHGSRGQHNLGLVG